MKNLKKAVFLISLGFNTICSANSVAISDSLNTSSGSSYGQGQSKCAKALEDYEKWSSQFNFKKEGIELPFLSANSTFVTGPKYVSRDINGKEFEAVSIVETAKDFPHTIYRYDLPLPKGPSIIKLSINGEEIEIHSNKECASMVKTKEGSIRGNFACKIKDLKEVSYTTFDNSLPMHFGSNNSPSPIPTDHFLRLNLIEIFKNYNSIKEKGLIDKGVKPLRERNFRACVTHGTVSGADLVADFNSMFPRNPITSNPRAVASGSIGAEAR